MDTASWSSLRAVVAAYPYHCWRIPPGSAIVPMKNGKFAYRAGCLPDSAFEVRALIARETGFDVALLKALDLKSE